MSAAAVWSRIAAGTARDLARCDPLAARAYVARKRETKLAARAAVRHAPPGRERDRARTYATARELEYRAALGALIGGAA